MATSDDSIRAAGVVCLRERPGSHDESTPSGPEVLLIHRTQLKDWSLPKGKLERGEHVAVAAVRETAEESGFDVVLGVPLTTQRYPVGDRGKEVAYWLARVVGRGPWEVNREVDEVRWVDIAQAPSLLTYPRDADLVRSATLKPRGTSPLVILRHAQAEKRSEYARRFASPPPDGSRPLTRVGERQSQDIAPVLAAYGVTRVHSSPYTRCFDTVAPHAHQRGIDIVEEPLLSEEGFAGARKAAMRRFTELLNDPAPMVVCTHRPVLPSLFEQLRRDVGVLDINPDLPAGGFVVVHRTVTASVSDAPGEAELSVNVVAVEHHTP